MFVHVSNKRFYFNLLECDDDGNLCYEQISLFRLVVENEFVFCPSYLNDYYEQYLKSHDIFYEILPFDLVIEDDFNELKDL